MDQTEDRANGQLDSQTPQMAPVPKLRQRYKPKLPEGLVIRAFDKELFAQNLRRLIAARNIQQKTLAYWLGITQSAVSFYTDGRTVPSVERLCLLSAILEVSLEELVYPKRPVPYLTIKHGPSPNAKPPPSRR